MPSVNQEFIFKNTPSQKQSLKETLWFSAIYTSIDFLFPLAQKTEKDQIKTLIQEKLQRTSKVKDVDALLKKIKKLSDERRMSPLIILKQYFEKKEAHQREKRDIQKDARIIVLNQKRELIRKNRNQTDNQQAQRAVNKEISSSFNKQSSSIETKSSSIETQVDSNRDREKIIQKTKEAYQKLNPSLKEHRPEEVQQKLKALSPVVRAKLKKNNIALGEYASFLLSREKITKVGKSPETEEFLKSLKTMERSLGIEEQTQWGYPLSYEPKAKVFDQNPDLAEFAKNDQAFSRLENVEVFPKGDERDQKLIEKFGDHGLKELAGKVASLDAKQKQGEALSIQEKEMITAYQQQLEALKTQMQSRLTNYLKASITQAPVVALMRYLGQESLGGKKLSDLLSHQDKPFATLVQETTLTGKTEPILQLKGMIEGKPLTFYYNLADPTASLECDDNLHYDPFSHQLSLWVQGKGNRTKLNLQMPTTKELSQRLEEALTPEKVKDIIDQASDLQDYQEKIWLLASDQLEDSFSTDETIHSRLARHTEKNLAIQELQAQLVPPEITHQLMKDGLINQHRPTQNVFRLLDRTSEESTDAELQSFRIAIKKLDSFLKSPNLSQKIMEIQDPILRNVLTKLSDANLKKSDFQVRSTAILDFFNLFTRQNLTDNSVNPETPDYKMNLSDFSRFIGFLDRPDQMITDPKHLEQFSPVFREKYQLQESAQQGGLSHLEDEIAAVYEEEPSYAYA